MACEDYMKFRELLKEKQYGEAAGYLADNPELKEMINLDESLEIINYYEEGINGLVLSKLNEARKFLKETNSKLEKTIKKIGDEE